VYIENAFIGVVFAKYFGFKKEPNIAHHYDECRPIGFANAVAGAKYF